MWDLDARGFHKGMWRFWIKKNHILTVGCPASVYCKKQEPRILFNGVFIGRECWIFVLKLHIFHIRFIDYKVLFYFKFIFHFPNVKRRSYFWPGGTSNENPSSLLPFSLSLVLFQYRSRFPPNVGPSNKRLNAGEPYNVE